MERGDKHELTLCNFEKESILQNLYIYSNIFLNVENLLLVQYYVLLGSILVFGKLKVSYEKCCLFVKRIAQHCWLLR